MQTNSRELTQILQTFTQSGWELIAAPARTWLSGRHDSDTLVAALREADNACGSCGCALDPLYKRALQLLAGKPAKISTPASNRFCPQTLFLYGTYKEDGTPNFGLFCWFSYLWNDGLGAMACIGGSKLTKDRIRETGVFSANLVTEELLPLADYFGNTPGYQEEKMAVPCAVLPGAKLPVPVLADSPVAFELQVTQTVALDGSDVLLCKIENVLMNETTADDAIPVEQRLKEILPVSTTCATYFTWSGRAIAPWGEAQNAQPQ